MCNVVIKQIYHFLFSLYKIFEVFFYFYKRKNKCPAVIYNYKQTETFDFLFV